ncbi:MAG TPA: glycosyltransferase family 2 protein [Stellaceae bacterium]|nr:glycosyltransferase family 2 protein [Stellaceae bacterium]
MICVIIVNFNAGRHLARAVEALRAQSFRDFETIIVDNASSDGSLEALPPLPAGFRIIRMAENLGFAAANNRAAAATNAPWIATLNPDAFAEPRWLEELALATRRYPDIPMFGSAQIDAADPARLDGAGDVYHISGLAWRAGGKAAALQAGDHEIFAPCAAAALYRRDLFLAMGGFDERYFCFCEDVDLAFRLRLAGFRCAQINGAVVHHIGGGTAARRGDFALYHGTRNRFWTFVKDMPGPLFWPLLPFHLGLTLVLTLRGRGVKACLRGFRDGIRGLPPIWAARQAVQGARRVPLTRLMRAFTWSPRALLRRGPDYRPL